MNYKQENIMQCNYRQNKEKGGVHSWILPSGTFHLIYCWWKAEDLMNDVGFPPAGVGKSLSGRSCHKDTVMSSCQICI